MAYRPIIHLQLLMKRLLVRRKKTLEKTNTRLHLQTTGTVNVAGNLEKRKVGEATRWIVAVVKSKTTTYRENSGIPIVFPETIVLLSSKILPASYGLLSCQLMLVFHSFPTKVGFHLFDLVSLPTFFLHCAC